MSSKKIPEKTIVTCDCCLGVFTPNGPLRRVMNGRLHLIRAGLDLQGCAVASNDVVLDLCDTCVNRVALAVQNECRNSQRKEPTC